MKHNLVPTLLFACILVVGGCGANYRLLSSRVLTETEILREQSEMTGLKSPVADSLYEVGNRLLNEGKYKDGGRVMEFACARYRLLLVENELEESHTLLRDLREELKNTRDRLTTYEKVLTQIEASEDL